MNKRVKKKSIVGAVNLLSGYGYYRMYVCMYVCMYVRVYLCMYVVGECSLSPAVKYRSGGRACCWR